MGASRLVHVSLKKYPSKVTIHAPNTTIVTGDIHGNIIRFLYFLLREGVISLPEDIYKQLIDLYYYHPFSKKSRSASRQKTGRTATENINATLNLVECYESL